MSDQITYVRGSATRPDEQGIRVLPHVCNDIGVWNSGYVLAIDELSPEPRRRYRGLFETPPGPVLGHIQIIQINENTVVINMIAQHGVMSSANPTPIRYQALKECLEKVRSTIAAMTGCCACTVHIPRIGCGRAGGDWNVVGELINQELCAHGIPVVVYDPPS